MKKYILPLILTLLGYMQLWAQNTDLRSAPDLPSVLVTLQLDEISNATATAKVGYSEIKSEGKVAYDSEVTLTVVTDDGYKLNTIYANGTAVENLSAGQFNEYSKQTTYTYMFQAKVQTSFSFNVQKKSVPHFSLNNLTQSYPNIVPVTVVSSVDPNSFTIKYQPEDYTGTNWYNYKNLVFTAGNYRVKVTRPQDDIYAEVNELNVMTVEPQQFQLTTSVDPYVTINKIEVNGKEISSTFPSGQQLVFTLSTAKDYKISTVKRDGKSLFLSTDNLTGKVQSDGKTIYNFTSSIVTQDVTFGFFSAPKRLLNDIVRPTNLEQTEGIALVPVTIEGTPVNDSFIVKYKYTPDGEWEDFDASRLKPGNYPLWIHRDADLDNCEYDNSTKYRLTIKERTLIPIVLNTENLTATSVEVGKPLSTSVLSGGYAVTDDANETTVVGTFEWKYPATMVSTAGEAEYAVVFTPIDPRYETVETSVKVKAVQYYTVTTGTSVNGKVEIKEANAANKYEAGTILTLIYTPDAHYQVAADQPTTYKVEKDAVITGQFKAIQHKVTIAKTENGSLTVKNGETVVADGAEVAEGTQLNITATPATGYKLAALTNGANPIRNNAITVEGDLNLQATFEALPAEEFVVTVADMANGKLLLLDENGNSVNKGASVKKGRKLTVVAVADKGYELAGDIKVGDTKVSGTYEVTADTKFEASFKKISYSITKTTADVTITVKKGETEVTAAEIGDVLKISAEVTNDSKRLLSLVVNGKEIANGGTYIVENAVNIVANLVDKTQIQFLDLNQVVTYDGNGKQFVVRSIPAGLQFTVMYEGVEEGQLPVYAANNSERTYKVTITRDADELYQAVDATGSLTIKAALAAYNAPTWENGTWSNGEEGSFKEEAAADDKAFRMVTFTPNNPNHQKVTFSVAKELDPDKKIIPNVTSNVTLRADAASSLNVEATGGTVTFWNGTAPVNEVYEGQTIIIKGLPNAGNSSRAVWTVGNTTTTGEELTFPVTTGENIIWVTFNEKAMPNLEKLKATKEDVEYTGSTILPEVTNETQLTGWNIVVKAGGLVVESPTEAGDYTVYASRSEDQVYAPVVEQEIGSYTIKPQTLKAEAFTITASAVMKGFSLSESVLSGTAPVAGTFTWANPAMIVEESTSYSVIFTPDSRNYTAEGLSLSTTVSIIDASTTVVVRKITFDTAEHGSFEVKVNGVVVTSGAQVTQGDKVEVSTIADNGYSLDAVKINDRVTTGVYTVGETGDVVVTVTFTKVTEPGTEPENPGGGTVVEPDPIIPTVSNPEVAERTATTAVITWEKVSGATSYKLFLYAKKGDTTPLRTYEFDKDGNLKATSISFTLTGLEEGKSYYVETAAYNALGTLLVKKSLTLSETPTGIEAISEGSQLYTVKGAVVVVPAEPLQVAIYAVTGQTLFNDEVSYLTQVPAKAGIYVVVIKKGANTITEKIIVR